MTLYIAVSLLLFLGGLTLFVIGSKVIYPLYLMFIEQKVISNPTKFLKKVK
ncbi:hypothetical protein SAMN00017405_0354 [Desulfonispora thiosulfatigenes DSM 11270]|uniref:Uncharacterized protein n=1 Tax=Desulfonispora thiosulfatigenes DSM 11270 TaxID=656914 RepID=A0A1W1VPD6_DESTI|nr:hypothetical protein [Desulfonispora thiosulfatigenes]SMB95218.1 hypothetical protein SAMN00017405_0354 [Desulfonispora thiosulfatigenes DSM 11270]